MMRTLLCLGSLVLLAATIAVAGAAPSIYKAGDDFVADPLTRSWSQMYVTFGSFSQLPVTEKDALSNGWVLNNTGGATSNGCQNGIWFGKRYVYQGDVSTMLLFDSLGQLAGFQIGLTSTPTGNIPPWEAAGGIYVFTSYYRDPATICTSNPSGGGNPIGDRLWLKLNSQSYMNIPLNENQVTNGTKWVVGKCFYTMGEHYWYGIYPQLDCDDLFPVFLLYNGGVLNGYGFGVMEYQTSPRYEHPKGNVINLFFQPETMPTCITSIDYISTMHLYFNAPLLDYC